MKKIILTSLVAAMTAVSAPTFAADDGIAVDASVSVANFYLWRGMNLGAPEDEGTFDSEPQVAADLNVSTNGLYAGTWVSSGDSSLGTEVDLYAGYGFETESGFSADLSYWSYLYPSKDTGFGEAAEIVGSLGYGPVACTLYYDVSKDNDDKDWSYVTVSGEYEKFGLLIGKHNDDGPNNGLLHTDLTYSYNDNLAFTLSVPVDVDKGDVTQDPMLNASLTLPIDL